MGKHHKVCHYIAGKSDKVSVKVKAAREPYARRHDLKTFDGDVVAWKYERLPEPEPEWHFQDGEWIAQHTPLTR